ncbi:alpha/beta fold hydrolase [Chitinophaga sp. HK235]|uniref:alpha/beta fold hydrolase n=1 Tax=Chitinophaga sp. HK235 TaxID=2952571 RepID=UPI001BAA7A4D|nr:hypothetical protein [Chitinophaga sp. HK235]
MTHFKKTYLAVLILLFVSHVSVHAQSAAAKGYAAVNGLKMYYEIQGSGEPLLLLHGAYMNIEGPFREMMNVLSRNRKVIVLESQGHGRTGDINRPITYEHMADGGKSQKAGHEPAGLAGNSHPGYPFANPVYFR